MRYCLRGIREGVIWLLRLSNGRELYFATERGARRYLERRGLEGDLKACEPIVRGMAVRAVAVEMAERGMRPFSLADRDVLVRSVNKIMGMSDWDSSFFLFWDDEDEFFDD